MNTWLQALARTRRQIAGAFARLFSRSGGALDEASLDELEATLILADVPAKLASEFRSEIETTKGWSNTGPRDRLRATLVNALGPAAPYEWPRKDPLLTILIVGVNGSGKTTTCAKLAHLAKLAGRRPLLGAADTFRAAGSDQLRLWAERIGTEVVVGRTGADAAATAYDALAAAEARGCDVAIVDTAGRMHTKTPLMEELTKVRRSMAKRIADAPHEIWLVLDASIGQNAISQARLFHEVAPLTGVVIAKLDGSAKAGFVFAITRELGLPIRYVGLGEGMEDLAPFDALAFVDALLGSEAGDQEASRAESRSSG